MPAPVRRRLATFLALPLSLACAVGDSRGAGGGAAPPPAAIEIVEAAPPAPSAPPAGEDAPPGPPAAGELAGRRLEYLERSWAQTRRLERGIGALGPERDGPAALATAALAAHGRVEPGEAARLTGRALEACDGRWASGGCERALLPLQRLVLQFPAGLPEPLLARLRASVAQPAPPPPPAQVADPWGFRQTENQRLVTVAGALGAHAVAGSGVSPPAAAWSDHAVALLAARDELGWYEEESAGYLGISVEALLHLRDFAPAPRVRRLADRQLDLLFARFAERQVGGIPGGARTRTYIHWALGRRNLPWPAWAWYAAGTGDPDAISFADWPVIAVSGYAVPEPVRRLLADRAALGSYEVRQRRAIEPGRRRSVDAAVYTWATPDFVLSTAQAVDGMELAVSGGEEIPVVLLAEGPEFAPLYLWSRVAAPRERRWRVRARQEQAVAHEGMVLARLGTGDEPGHAYLAPAWEEPRVVGDAVVTRYGDTWVALVTAGGWELAPAAERFPAHYGGDRAYRDAVVAVPKRQPAAVALEVVRAADAGEPAAWRERMAGRRLEVERDEAGDPLRIAYRAGGEPFEFRPGRSASVGGRPLEPRAWPLHDSPVLGHRRGEGWELRLEDGGLRFEALPENRRPPP